MEPLLASLGGLASASVESLYPTRGGQNELKPYVSEPREKGNRVLTAQAESAGGPALFGLP
jgi:hypothetical protein